MPSTGYLRIRRLLAKQGPIIAVVLVFVGVSAIGVSLWIYQHPPTTQVTDEVKQERIQTSLSTAATATGETDLYQQGTQLNNEPVYLQKTAPTVRLILKTRVFGGTDVLIKQRLVLVTSAVHKGTVFWRETRTLVSTHSTTGHQAVSRATLNVSKIRNRLANQSKAIGDAGKLSSHLRFRVHYETGQYTGTFSRQLPVSLGSSWYEIPTSTVTRERHTTRTRTETAQQDRLTYLATAAVGFMSIFGGIAVALLWKRRLRDVDIERLTRKIQHQSYNDWFSSGTLENVEVKRRIPVESIEDIVDIAIDSNLRVIHDADRGLYAVMTDTTLYYYRPVEEWDWQDAPMPEADD